eukprot:SM000021S06401  [mRNA]  locus=s21:40363:45979:+ [translate_table: standard]
MARMRSDEALAAGPSAGVGNATATQPMAGAGDAGERRSSDGEEEEEVEEEFYEAAEEIQSSESGGDSSVGTSAAASRTAATAATAATEASSVWVGEPRSVKERRERLRQHMRLASSTGRRDSRRALPAGGLGALHLGDGGAMKAGAWAASRLEQSPGSGAVNTVGTSPQPVTGDGQAVAVATAPSASLPAALELNETPQARPWPRKRLGSMPRVAQPLSMAAVSPGSSPPGRTRSAAAALAKARQGRGSPLSDSSPSSHGGGDGGGGVGGSGGGGGVPPAAESMYRIKDLDSGREFVLEEGDGGRPSTSELPGWRRRAAGRSTGHGAGARSEHVRDLSTGTQLTLEEFESSLGGLLHPHARSSALSPSRLMTKVAKACRDHGAARHNLTSTQNRHEPLVLVHGLGAGVPTMLQEMARRDRGAPPWNAGEEDWASQAVAKKPKKARQRSWLKAIKVYAGRQSTREGATRQAESVAGKSHDSPAKVDAEAGRVQGAERIGVPLTQSSGEWSGPESTGAASAASSFRSELAAGEGEPAAGASVASLVKTQVHRKLYKELTDLRNLQNFRAHHGAIWVLKFNASGRLLATGGQDAVVRIWDVRKGGTSPASEGLVAAGGAEDGSGSDSGSCRSGDGRARPPATESGRHVAAVGLGVAPFWLAMQPARRLRGHGSDVLDLSWSRNQKFLLSSSMDKTVRLWHIGLDTCLRVFHHNDYGKSALLFLGIGHFDTERLPRSTTLTCIDFDPMDDKYFLSGSLDQKLRIWSVPQSRVIEWADAREMITAGTYTHDGQRAVIGSYRGTGRFYRTEGHKLRLEGQVDVRSTRGRNAVGKKITGIHCLPGDASKVLVTSNDSRLRLYDGTTLTCKYKGHQLASSHAAAQFSAAGDFILCASEDGRVLLWPTLNTYVPAINPLYTGFRKDRHESYEAFNCPGVTACTFWPGEGNAGGAGIGNITSTTQQNDARPAGSSGGTAAPAAVGLVVVAASYGGELRTFQNFGLPVWL